MTQHTGGFYIIDTVGLVSTMLLYDEAVYMYDMYFIVYFQ